MAWFADMLVLGGGIIVQDGTAGTPIVLVHGFGAHAYHWRYQ